MAWMEREGGWRRKEEVKENAKVFVLSTWVGDNGHGLLWGRLEELKRSVLNRLSLRCLFRYQIVGCMSLDFSRLLGVKI